MERTYERVRDVNVSKKLIGSTNEVAASAASPRRLIDGIYREQQQWAQRAEENERESLLGTKAAVFTHELANSLTVVSSSLQFVEMELQIKGFSDPALTATIQAAIEEIGRLGKMLNEFRSPEHGLNCNLVSTDLVKVVKEVLALEMFVCRAGGIIVESEFENALPLVMLDAAKMKQVVLNLCKNSVEAMPKGGCLTVKIYRSEGTVVLEITDNGIGVPKTLKTFELFKTTKPGGSGIGLSVVQEIVSAHNATITCSSDAGRDTTFKIVLPATT